MGHLCFGLPFVALTALLPGYHRVPLPFVALMTFPLCALKPPVAQVLYRAELIEETLYSELYAYIWPGKNSNITLRALVLLYGPLWRRALDYESSVLHEAAIHAL